MTHTLDEAPMTQDEIRAELAALATERMEGLRKWCQAMSAQIDAPVSGCHALLPYQGQTAPTNSVAGYAAAVRRTQVMLNSRDKKLAERALRIVETTGVVPISH